MDIGEQIRKYRKEAGLSQKKLGEMLGVSQQHIAQYENGKRIPKLETTEKIAVALGVSTTDLLDWKYIPEVFDEVYASSILTIKDQISDSRYRYSVSEQKQIKERIADYISEGNKIENLDERENYYFNVSVNLSHEMLKHLIAPYSDEDITDIVDLISYYLSFTDTKQGTLLELFSDLYENKYLRRDYWEKENK